MGTTLAHKKGSVTTSGLISWIDTHKVPLNKRLVKFIGGFVAELAARLLDFLEVAGIGARKVLELRRK